MTTYQITAPQQLRAAITLPASKSISNRALIVQALAGGTIMPENLSDCDDTEVVIAALTNRPDTIDIKAAGTAMRFMTAYLSVTEGEHTITGTERMKRRPIGILVDALRMLGADISYVEQEGYPPLHIKGQQLMGGRLDVPGNISSQYISALLMIGPMMQHGIELHLTGSMVSRPYIDLTLSIMKQYGANVDWTGVDTIAVRPRKYKSIHYTVENDWSAASYWYEMAALWENQDVELWLKGLVDGSQQGDSIVKYIYSLMGIKTSFKQDADRQADGATLTRRMGRIQKLDFDFINCPDLAQTVVVTCCALDIHFHFTGLASLKIKETDRIEALKTELRKVGYVIRSANDAELMWDGERCDPTDTPIDTYEDHRMAMAFAPLAIKQGSIRINNPEVVTKSYPGFWDDLRLAGFRIDTVGEV